MDVILELPQHNCT